MNCVKVCQLVLPKLASNLRTAKGTPSLLCLRLVHQSSALRQDVQKDVQKDPKAYLESLRAPEYDEIEVYYGPLSARVRSVKLFSLLTSVAGICAQPVILHRAAELEASSAAIAATCSVVGFFTFVTPLLLHTVTKKYVTTVTWDKEADSYTATIYSLFLRKRQIRFKPGEAEIPEIGGLTSAIVRGVPLFMDSRFFTDVYHYKRIMGYDKPMDFKLNPKKDVT